MSYEPSKLTSNMESPLSRLKLIGFVALLVPVTAAQIPMSLYLPTLYATQFGLSLASIGAIFLLGRTWDAITDPLIGTLSDRTRTRYGRRRPWIAFGSLLFAAAAIFLFFPMGKVTPIYLLATLFFFYLGWTMIQIPLYAWMGEISGQYHQRTRIVTYAQTVQSTALLLILLLPAIVDRYQPNAGELKLALMGVFILVTLIPSAVLTLSVIPEPSLPSRVSSAVGIVDAIRSIGRDRLLLRILASDFAVTLAQYIRAATFLFFITAYVGLPAWAGTLFLVQAVFGVAAAPIWLKVAYRIGKHRAVIAGELTQVVINLCLLLVMPGSLSLLIVLMIAQGLAQGSGNQMLRAIVADVADAHRLQHGVDRTGLLFSVFSLSGKAATAVAIGVTLPLLAALGFHANGVNSSHSLLALKLIFALGPAFAHLLSAWLVRGFPIDEQRQQAIRAELEQRAYLRAAPQADQA